jgi:hypothetical protein
LKEERHQSIGPQLQWGRETSTSRPGLGNVSIQVFVAWHTILSTQSVVNFSSESTSRELDKYVLCKSC